MDFFVLPQLINQVDTEITQGSIIKANISFAQEKGILLLIGFSLIYRECDLLGNPVEISI